LNVVIVSWRDNNADLQLLSDDSNNQYVPMGKNSQSGNGQQQIWFAPNIVGGSNSIYVSFLSTKGNCVSKPEVRIAEYRGLSTNSGWSAVDLSSTQNTSSSVTCNSGNKTTTNQNDMLIGANLAAQTTTAPGANYGSRLVTTPLGDILEDQIVTAVGSYNASGTMAASGNCLMQMVAFKQAPNQAPVVNPGPNQTISLPTNSVTLAGTATDDGLPNNTLTITWSKLSGPGTVTFGSPSSAITQATFSIAGTYVLQLTANDSQLQNSATTTITVNPAFNPPTVSAGPNQTITLPANVVTLNGSATDGGLPLTTSWSAVSGPGPVLFANVASQVTTAMFGTAGVYDVRLTAGNGQTSASADATITVNPQANTPPGATIVLSPGSAGPILTSSSQQLQATITNNTGGALANTLVTFTVTGPNHTSGSATTNANGIATFSYTGNNQGVDAIVATATAGALLLTSNTSMISWALHSVTVTGSTVQGQFFSSPHGSGAFDIPAGTQPVFTQTFSSVNFNPPTGSIPGMPNSFGVTTTPFTDVTTDVNGNYTGSVIAQGNGVQAGVGTLSSFEAVFTGTLNVAAAGSVTFNFLNADGFVFGVGNGATRVAGTIVNAPAPIPPSTQSLTPFNGYSVMGSFNTVAAAVMNTITVNFPSAGSYPYEIDYADSSQAALIPAGSTWKYKVANASLSDIKACCWAPISRTNGVVSITMGAALYDLTVGSAVTITGVSDQTNFPNSTQTVASIGTIDQSGPYGPSTTFTVNWPGQNASSSGGDTKRAIQ
jgi:hypothetical protein